MDYYDKAYFLPDMTEVNRYKNSVLLSSRIVKENNDTSIWVSLTYSNLIKTFVLD